MGRVYDEVKKFANKETEQKIKEIVRAQPAQVPEEARREYVINKDIKVGASLIDSVVAKEEFINKQKENVGDLLDHVYDKRRKQLEDFRASYLFNTEEKAKVFSKKYPMPLFKFTKTMSRTEILNLNRDMHIAGAIEKGFKYFEWMTAGDERVRESHKKLDGKIFSKDKIPFEYNDINCRCTILIHFHQLSENKNKLIDFE